MPRLYEKVCSKLPERIASSSPVKRALFRWATATYHDPARFRVGTAGALHRDRIEEMHAGD